MACERPDGSTVSGITAPGWSLLEAIMGSFMVREIEPRTEFDVLETIDHPILLT